MKNILTAFFVCAFAITASAQMSKMKAPVQSKTTPVYENLIGKDINAAMKAFNMKDTIGKTKSAYIPQVEKGTKYLLLLVPNGDQLAFKNNKLAAILPKQ